MNNIHEITITEVADKLRKKELSVQELVQEYSNRIRQLDQCSDGLNSVIELNPDALDIAKELDKQGFEGKSPLYGIPILLKDNIDTADNMHTSAGSLALAESIAAQDADIVKALRRKGAVLLGKANMTEFANYMTKGMPAGYSSRGGQVISPYDLAADPSGSSTGSAVAVSANLCTASIGTDTAGSIVSPAIKNGIVGLRPSEGTISTRGIIPISFTQDTVGPMTRTVKDATILYTEITGAQIHLEEPKSIKGMRIGINQAAFGIMTEEESKKSEIIIKELENAGALLCNIMIETIPTHDIKTISKYEFKYAMNKYLEALPSIFQIRTLKDIISYNEKHPKETLRYGQSLLLDAELNTSGELNENIYKDLLKDKVMKKQQMREMLRAVDVCILFKDNLILQYTGLPISTLPCGLYNDGLPFGIFLTANSENELLKNAYALEQIIGRRIPPNL